MRIENCSRCGTAIFDFETTPHSCTEFLVTCEDYGYEDEPFWVEDPKYLMKRGRYTPTHEDAAEAWARWLNESGDYDLMNEETDITVSRNGDTRRFRVGAEPSIDYSVELLEQADAQV